LAEQIRDLFDAAAEPVTLDDVVATLAKRSEAPAEARRRGWNGWAVLAVTGVAIASVIAVLVVGLSPSSGPTLAAAATLEQLSGVAGSEPPVSPGNGQYLYYATTEGQLASGFAVVPGKRVFPLLLVTTTQTWVARDGTGRQRIVTATPTLLLPQEQQAWEAAGSPTNGVKARVTDTDYPTPQRVGGSVTPGPYGVNRLAYPPGPEVPTDPVAVAHWIQRTYHVTGGPATSFLIAGGLLEQGASPASRSALYQYMRQLRGVQLIGSTHDEAGRKGVGLAIDGYGNRYVLIVDPKTSAVLGLKISSLRASAFGGRTIPKGTQIGFTNYGPTVVTSSTSVVPESR
jgi:hypothetical protein